MPHTTPVCRPMTATEVTDAFQDRTAPGDSFWVVQDELGREVAVFVKHENGTVEQVDGH